MMKKFLKYLLIFALVPALVLSSCKKDEEDENPDTTPDQFETLRTYMADNDMDITDLYRSKADGTFWVKAGAGIVDSSDYSVPNFYIIDIRGVDDFNLGHIKDAHNTTLGGILDEAANATKGKILVVCYTGQTAARGVAALRLSGFDAFCLKWGMCGWNATFDAKWVANAGDQVTSNWKV